MHSNKLLPRIMKLIRTFLLLFTLSALSISSQATDKHALTHPEEAQLLVDMLGETLATPDKADYSRDFYFKNYMTSLQARDEMPWGKMVPKREFRHFVLPVRINNENLDTARIVFYNELKHRVKGLSMKDAILEVNHWCHEKVSYRPSDARTSSPLATVRTAYGRCGEESTLLVAALRSVCIPARQVYTPRWAHTDDNHAWVEAWADGEWFFLGACEPEPVLNLGWFNESASRGMLMHTKVAGDYHGPEQVVSRTPCYTEINVTHHYSPTSLVELQIIDKEGNPVSGATVEFKLYNYAEFYTLVTKTTAIDGKVSLNAGKGDLLVWVTKDNLVAIKKVSWMNPHTETITLHDKSLPQHLNIDIVPPAPNPVIPAVTAEQRSLNDHRKAQEDSTRQAYEATMPVEAWRGNHHTIQQFLDKAKNKVMAYKLLEVISAKDLRDIGLDVLCDNEVATTDTSYIYSHYVLNPRVENEWLTPYKAFFKSKLGHFKNIDQLIEWTKDNITIDNEHNPQHLRQQPMSVYSTRSTDELGRAIFLVSAARSLGWPARINEVNGKLEYYASDTWHEVKFEQHDMLTAEPAGTLRLSFTPTTTHNDLSYYTHFTLSKIEDGRARLLTYPDDATWSKTFKNGVTLEPGTYMLTTGNRQSDGSVLAATTTFEIKPQEITNIPLLLREKQQVATVLGKLKDGLPFYNQSTHMHDTLPQGKKYILGFIVPSHEPTNHALRDIATCAKQFEQWGGKIILLNLSETQERRFNKAEFTSLPNTVTWGIDTDRKILNCINQQLQLQSQSMPLFLIVDKDGNITFIKQGYTIHLGEQILKAIKIHANKYK